MTSWGFNHKTNIDSHIVCRRLNQLRKQYSEEEKREMADGHTPAALHFSGMADGLAKALDLFEDSVIGNLTGEIE